MDTRALFRWLAQTPWLALLGAFGFIVLVAGIAQSGTDFLAVPGWALQAGGAVMFALFLLLVTFHHHDSINRRLIAVEGRADDLRAEKMAQLNDRVEHLTDYANESLLSDDRGRMLRVRPKIAALMMSLDREFCLGLDLRSGHDPKRYLNGATAFLFTAWPFLRDGHMESVKVTVTNYNKLVAAEVTKQEAKDAKKLTPSSSHEEES